MLVRRENIVNNCIIEFIGSFTVLHHHDRSRIVALGQDGVSKRYTTSQIRTYLEQPPVLEDSITERKIEGRLVKTENDPDKPEYDGANEQLNVD